MKVGMGGDSEVDMLLYIIIPRVRNKLYCMVTF